MSINRYETLVLSSHPERSPGPRPKVIDLAEYRLSKKQARAKRAYERRQWLYRYLFGLGPDGGPEGAA